MAMMRQTEKQWKELQKVTKVPDPVIEDQEAERKRKVDLEILLAIGTVQDRQAAEDWRQPERVIQPAPQKKPGIMAKILLALWLAFLRWWNAPKERRQAPAPRRSARSAKTSSRSTAPKRKKGFMEDVPDFGGPDFDGPDWGDGPFGNGPRF